MSTTTLTSIPDAVAIRLAKTFAEVHEFEGRSGGWIYSPAGRPVAHGWVAFAKVLRRRGIIAASADGSWFINWRQHDLRPVR